MTIPVPNPIQQTWLFYGLLFAVAVFSMRKKVATNLFSIQVTQELKGAAILLVIFSHVGYFLAQDNRFLFPFSALGGVGVDIFLFLSGLGLTISALQNTSSLKDFYLKRLPKLFVPFWIVTAALLLMDFFILGIRWPWQFIITAAAGIFTSASVYQDFNSPCWYLTLILFYYIVFPLVFLKKYPWLSALIIYAATLLIFWQNIFWFDSVLTFYRLHTMAFPLGMIIAWLFLKQQAAGTALTRGRWIMIATGLVALAYFLVTPNTGPSLTIKQIISITTMMVIILLFALKTVELKIFSLFGLYSYEIYLMHWPLMYRYGIFYRFAPAWLATLLWLAVLVVLGAGLHIFNDFFMKRQG